MPELTDLSKEPADVLAQYGAEPGKESFANNCLLARRLAERGFTGILQVDGYAGYRALAERNTVQLAFCWSHVRREFIELAKGKTAPIATETLQRIAALYKKLGGLVSGARLLLQRTDMGWATGHIERLQQALAEDKYDTKPVSEKFEKIHVPERIFRAEYPHENPG